MELTSISLPTLPISTPTTTSSSKKKQGRGRGTLVSPPSFFLILCSFFSLELLLVAVLHVHTGAKTQKNHHFWHRYPILFVSLWQNRVPFVDKDGNHFKGIQIDLLIDRRDGIIDLCEMKFTTGEFYNHGRLRTAVARAHSHIPPAYSHSQSLLFSAGNHLWAGQKQT